jgi:K+-sensing histidine kinase KdpD
MHLQRRLTWFTLILIGIITISLGVFLVESAYRDSKAMTNRELTQIINSINQSKEDKLTTALTAVRTSSLAPILLLIDQDQEALILYDPGNEEGITKINEITVSVDGEVGNLPTAYQSQVVAIEGDAFLVVLKDISQIGKERTRSYLYLLIFGLLSIFLAQLILRKLISRDVERESEVIRLEEKLNFERNKREMLLEFMADASHELRTPLTIMKGYISLANKNSQISDSEIVEKLKNESVRLEKNIESLLTVLEFESIPENLLAPINLSNLLKQEFDEFAKREFSRDVKVEITEKIKVLASEELILKLVRNALLNITRHASDSKIVSLKLFRSANEIVIAIEDSGPLGVQQTLILDDYIRRFNSNRAAEKGGSGLGFSIMHSAVRKLSGRLEIFRSDLGGFGLKIYIPTNID